MKPACCRSHTEAAAGHYNEILSKRVNFPLDREREGEREGRRSGAAGLEEETDRGNVYCYYTELERQNNIKAEAEASPLSYAHNVHEFKDATFKTCYLCSVLHTGAAFAPVNH